MRNDLVNKKVVSSIGIGIMALVTAVSPSMGVFAEEAEGDSLEQDVDVEQTSEQVVESEAQNAEVSNEIADAQDVIDEAQKEIEAGNTLEELDENEYISDPSVSKDLEETDDALGALDQNIEGLDEANQDAAEKKEDWEETLDAATNEEGNGWLDHVSEDTSEAKDAAEGLGDIINDEIASEAEEKAEEVEESQKVTYESEEAAQEAKDQANETAKEVEEVRDQAQEAYDEAAEKLEIAENNREIADELWKSAEKSYNDAVAAVDAAKAELERILAENGIDVGDLDPETLDPTDFSGNVKTALENAAAALAQAEIDAKTAAENVEKAQKDLEEAERALADASDKKEVFEGTLKDLNDASMELESAKDEQGKAEQAAIAAAEALKKAQQELLAGEAKKQKEQSEAASKAYEEIKKTLKWEAITDPQKQAAWEAREAARAELVSSMEEQAKTQIKYQLLDCVNDVGDIVFGNWISDRSENNYVYVSYINKEGNICHEYYHYKEIGDGDIRVVKKIISDNTSYLNAGGASLVETDENGEKRYSMKGNPLPDGSSVEGTAETGYTVTISSEQISSTETATCHPSEVGAMLVDIELKKVTLSNGEIVYFVNGIEVAVKYDQFGNIIQKIGDIDVLRLIPVWKSAENSETKIFFGPTFTSKGDDCNITIHNSTESLSDLQEAAEKARADKNDRDNDLITAIGKVSSAQDIYNKHFDSAKSKLKDESVDISGDEVKEALTGFISELVASINTLETSRNAAVAEKTKREGMNSTADAIFEKIKGVNTAVTYAVKKLADLSAQSGVDKAQYEAAKELYDEAVENCLVAAEKKGASEADLNRIKAAADRARAAADAQFAYNTSETNPGGGTGGNTNPGGGTGGNTNPGGTTGGNTNPGGITGGGAGTGTTGGGTGGAGTGTAGGGTGGAGTGTVRAAIPAAAGPIVAIPTTAVPLAGPDAIVADAGEEAGATDGLTTLEDGATPLASADNMTETENLEDEETPLVSPSEGRIQMSWWWLLVIALLGVSGEEMYRKYMKKARAKKIED